MELIVKLMDSDNKGFRIITVTEPVDFQVTASDPELGGRPSFRINHLMRAMHRAVPIEGNVYVMNTAGDTISKVDAKDLGIKSGMGGLYREALREGSMTVDIPSLVGADPEKIIEAARAIFFNANPHLREELTKAGLTLGSVTAIADNPDTYDEGTALFSGPMGKGAYLGGEFVDANALTAPHIRSYKVFATPEMVEELRKEGIIPETKLALLAKHYEEVNGKPKALADEECVYRQTPPNQKDLAKAIFGNLEENVMDQAIGHILRNAYGHQVVIMAESFPGGETIYVTLDGRFSRSYTPGRGIVKYTDLSKDKFNEMNLQLQTCKDNYDRVGTKERCTFFDVRIVDGSMCIIPWIQNIDQSLNKVDPFGVEVFGHLLTDAQAAALATVSELCSKQNDEVLGCLVTHDDKTVFYVSLGRQAKYTFADTEENGSTEFAQEVMNTHWNVPQDHSKWFHFGYEGGFFVITRIKPKGNWATTKREMEIIGSHGIPMDKDGPVNGIEAMTGSQIG